VQRTGGPVLVLSGPKHKLNGNRIYAADELLKKGRVIIVTTGRQVLRGRAALGKFIEIYAGFWTTALKVARYITLVKRGLVYTLADALPR